MCSAGRSGGGVLGAVPPSRVAVLSPWSPSWAPWSPSWSPWSPSWSPCSLIVVAVVVPDWSPSSSRSSSWPPRSPWSPVLVVTGPRGRRGRRGHRPRDPGRRGSRRGCCRRGPRPRRSGRRRIGRRWPDPGPCGDRRGCRSGPGPHTHRPGRLPRGDRPGAPSCPSRDPSSRLTMHRPQRAGPSRAGAPSTRGRRRRPARSARRPGPAPWATATGAPCAVRAVAGAPRRVSPSRASGCAAPPARWARVASGGAATTGGSGSDGGGGSGVWGSAAIDTATTVLHSNAPPTANPRAAGDGDGQARPSRRRRSTTSRCAPDVPRRCVAMSTSLSAPFR